MAARFVLVTGCTGMAGSRILQQLGAVVKSASDAAKPLPFRFRFAVRNPATVTVPDGVDGEAVALDFGDPSTFEACLSGVERAFILFHPNNGTIMPPFFDACRSYGVKHVVMMTVMHADTMTMLPHHKAERQFIAALTKASSAAYNEVSPLAHTLEPLRPLVAATDAGDEPASEAAATESAAESAPVSPGRPTFTLVRPSWFMENLTRPGIHLPDILETDELYMPAGTGRVHLVHGSDVGEVVARLLVDNADGERPHAAHCDTAYAITSAQALTFAEIAAELSDVVGRPIRYTNAWVAPFVWHITRKRGLPMMLAMVMTLQYNSGIAGGNAETLTPTVKGLFGGREPRSLREFLEETRATFIPESSKVAE